MSPAVRTKTTTEVVTSSQEVEWLHKGDLIDALGLRLERWQEARKQSESTDYWTGVVDEAAALFGKIKRGAL